MSSPVIDAHTHLHPPRLFAAIRRWFAERSSWDISVHPTEPPAVADCLRRAGVDRFIFFSYAHRTGIARELNAWLVETSRSLDRFGIPLGTVHLDDPAYLEDARLALEAGCAGFKIHEDVQRLALDDERVIPVFEMVEAHGGAVVAHVGPIPWDYLPGAGLERVRRVLTRHPRLSLIVAHLGVPDTSAYFALMDAFPNLYLDTTMLLAASSPIRPPVDLLPIGTFATRVLYGTDFPNIPYAYESERSGLTKLGFGPEVEAAVLGGNAARIFARFL